MIFFLIKNEFITNDISLVPNTKGGVVFGLSIAVETPQTFLSNQTIEEKTNEAIGFLLQSQSPLARVYLDYISIHNNAPETSYCFTSFRLNKDPSVPYQIIDLLGSDSKIGKLENREDQPNEHIFNLFEPICVEKGTQYFLPHIFMGIIRSETSANIYIDEIRGRRALEFFPFEKQVMNFSLSAHYIDNNTEYNLPANFDITISEPGWLGSLDESSDPISLTLTRPQFYQIAVVVFFFVMAGLIIFLNNLIDDVGGFFEIAFGLLLGLWGTHEILIPNYIESSIPIDVIIYLLYALVISEMVTVSIDEYFVLTRKRRIKILRVIKRDLRRERVIIENPSLLPVDMTGWLLFDQALNKFKFPVYVLQGKNFFTGKKNTVTVWTKSGENDKSNLYWGRRQEVWNNFQETAFLEDAKGDAIDNCDKLVDAED
jgi:hypothetical protein